MVKASSASRLASIAMVFFACIPATSSAFEADVHYGLTQWLALQAGFSAPQSEAIAQGNQRADSGVMDSVVPLLEYACLARSPGMSKVAQSYHFATTAVLPAPAEQRQIAANSDAARRKLDAVMAAAKTKADSHLFKLGEALHLLQDSWAYQGTPDQPAFQQVALTCDPALVWTTPKDRGGWNSHKGDTASQWPDDTAAMAAATYQHLSAYPALAGAPRTAKPWPDVRKQLDGFLQANTKTDQRKWFMAQGITNTAFLQGISLPDGAGFASLGPLAMQRALPPLRADATTQYTATQDVKDFFDTFFARWLMSPKPESALGKPASAAQRSLAARLKVWRLQDHGAAESLAHTQGTLSASQIQKIDGLAKRAGAYVAYEKLSDAFFPLLEDSPKATPLLPYIIHALPASEPGKERAIAVTKLRHVPYDEIGVVAEKVKGEWRAVDLISVVSH